MLGNTTGKSKISIKDILRILPSHVFFNSHKISNSFPRYPFLFILFVIISLPSIIFRTLPFRFPPNIENPALLGYCISKFSKIPMFTVHTTTSSSIIIINHRQMKHIPKPVCEDGDVTVLWNHAVHTDREVTANRPDIIIKNKKEKTCTLIDVAIPAGRNVVQKEAEKKLKYKSLCIEIQRMWNLKCTIVPVIIGATGIVTRSLRKNLETVPGKHSIDSLQKTDILRNFTHNTKNTAV